jgi:hypothetical protein
VTVGLEIVVAEERRDVFLPACEVIVHGEDVVGLVQQALEQVGAEATGAAGDQDTLAGQRHRGPLAWNRQR